MDAVLQSEYELLHTNNSQMTMDSCWLPYKVRSFQNNILLAQLVAKMKCNNRDDNIVFTTTMYKHYLFQLPYVT